MQKLQMTVQSLVYINVCISYTFVYVLTRAEIDVISLTMCLDFAAKNAKIIFKLTYSNITVAIAVK